MSSRRRSCIATSALLVWSATAVWAVATPAQLCAGAKIKAAALEAKRKLLCHASAVRSGIAVDPECLARAESRLFAAFELSEGRGGCATVGDADAIDGAVDAFTASIVAALPSAHPSATPSLGATRTSSGTETPTPTPESPTPTPPDGAKRIFVTSFLPLGNLGGVNGADAFCQQLATDASLPGAYKAWLSDDANSAASRLTHSTDPYVLVDGTPLAVDWTDLTDGTLLAAITRTETGESVSASAVWTGTDESAGATAPNCRNWTSDATFDGGAYGTASADFNWTRSDTRSCGAGARLYCVQQ
jgi:hypothetical protein